MYSLPSLPLYSASSWSFVSVLNSWTQNCQKSQILRLLKVSQLKHRFQPRYAVMVIMVKYIPRFHFFYKLKCFQGFLRWKKKCTRSFGIKFGWNFQWFPYFYLSLEQGLIQSPFVTFVLAVCVPHVHMNTLNYALSSFIQSWISHKPVNISCCTCCIRFK